jgi:hypothetical protein
MKHRKLRNGWSVAWGIVAVLLVALWVRSYCARDTIVVTPSAQSSIAIYSMYGRFFLGVADVALPIHFKSSPLPPWEVVNSSEHTNKRLLWFTVDRRSRSLVIGTRFWLLLSCTAVFAGMPWLPWWSNRFSLRTLLIATTLVAVGLGLIVWLSQ